MDCCVRFLLQEFEPEVTGSSQGPGERMETIMTEVAGQKTARYFHILLATV